MKKLFKNKKNVFLIFIVFISLFLRFYRIEENFIFTGEVGHNLLEIKKAYINKQIPLLGPPTSHPWLYFAPLFYWIYGPILILSNFNPLSHAYFGAFVSFLIVIVNYLVIVRYFNKTIALLSSFFIAISPLFLEFSRAGRFFSIVTLLVYFFIYYLFEVILRKKNKFFHLGIILGSMFSFHFTPIMLIPFTVSVFIISKFNVLKKQIFLFIAGFILPMLPFIFYDVTHSMSMTKNIILWIPYRILGFIGLYPKNNISMSAIKYSFDSYTDLIVKSFTVLNPALTIIILIILIILIISRDKINIVNKLNLEYKIILLWFIWGCIAVFVHGSPPIHYFVPILPAPIIIISSAISRLMEGRIIKHLIYILIFVTALINLSFYFTDKWFYVSEKGIIEKPYYVPYSLQDEITNTILKDAKAKRFTLNRAGIYDYFEGDYAQNYQYLLWLKGNEPVNNAKLVYTIYEKYKVNETRSKPDIIGNYNDVSIVKEFKR